MTQIEYAIPGNKNVVEQHGCKLVDIDFETHSLKIEGPEDAQAECALALEKVLG